MDRSIAVSECSLTRKPLQMRVWEALESLPHPAQDFFKAIFFSDLSEEEISELFAVTTIEKEEMLADAFAALRRGAL